MPSFYHPELNQESHSLDLNAEESKHAIKARRLRVGDSLNVINGCGGFAECTLVSVEEGVARLKVDSIELQRRPPKTLVVASALPKGDRMRFMVDMLAQLGVDNLIPLRCDHSVQKFSSNLKLKLNRYALEACKQSNNAWLMSIDDEQTVADLALDYGSDLIYADGAGARPAAIYADNSNSLPVRPIAIGPEGGFSAHEIDLMAKQGAQALKLGETILRTETAAVVAAAAHLGFMSGSERV